jgi:hypothetical protein
VQVRCNRGQENRDLCDLTSDFEGFLQTYPLAGQCDGIWGEGDDPEYAPFCNAIAQTVAEFEAGGIVWGEPNTFPFVCGPFQTAPTVCSICQTINQAYTDNPNPDYKALTVAIVDGVISEEESCSNAIRQGNNGGQYGIHTCSYVVQINNDFTCQRWTGIASDCDAAGTVGSCRFDDNDQLRSTRNRRRREDCQEELQTCFDAALTSTLIQTAGNTLYQSAYCQETFEARLLQDKILV